MSPISSWLGQLSFWATIGLVVHALAARPGRDQAAAEKGPPWGLALRATVEFATIWIWLSVALPLIGWLYWYGDNGHPWFPHYAWAFAAAIALAAPARSATRQLHRRTSSLYARIHFWVPVLLLISFCGVRIYEAIRPIKGTTPDAAAENILAEMNFAEPVRLVRAAGPPADVGHAPGGQSYWIMGEDEPRGRLGVWKRSWLGWEVHYTMGLRPSQQELARAREAMNIHGNTTSAKLILESIIENYPDTPAQAKARELLRSLEDS